MLCPGDTVAAVTLSWGGPGTFPYRYEIGKKQLEEEFQVKVVEMPNTLRDAGWLSENPQARADDLMRAFSDPSINGIISTIGGDDSIRILPYLDYDLIRKNPKVFLGFSDTTVTHLACLKAGIVSFYGSAIMTGFAENGGMFPYLVESVRRTLFSPHVIGQLEPSKNGWTAEILDWAEPAHQTQKRKLLPSSEWRFLQGTGSHKGHLFGGCIEVLGWLRGTEVWPLPEFWKDAILFLETSEDAPPPIEVTRSLRVLAAMGVLKQINGLLIGRPGGQVPVEKFSEYDDAVMQVVNTEEGLRDLPVVTMMDFGHTDPIMVLPIGIECEIDCDDSRIRINENAVVE